MNKFTVACIVVALCGVAIWIELQDKVYTLNDFIAAACFFAAGVMTARFRIWKP